MKFFGRTSTVLVLLSLIVLIGTIIIVAPRFTNAQTSDTSSSDTSSTASSDVAAKRAALQAQLNQLDTEIAQTQSTLDTLHTQHSTLQNQIDTLDAQIKKAQLQLQATQVQITALQSNIVIQNNNITALTGTLTTEQEGLASIIRQTNEIDNYSLVEVVLSAQDVSSFFGDLDDFNTIQQELDSSYQQVSSTRSQTEVQKSQLEDQQTQAEQLAQEETLEQQQIQSAESQKQTLLNQTKGQEATYQSIYNIQQETISQIKAELFALAGGSGQISLPTAIALAKQAGSATGVDPALILGILKQETNIGQNVGTASWTDAMNPTRDVPVFKVIMQTLGIDPNSVKVSAAPSYGWGGAMGPAQFIPSTWACYGGYINTTTGSCGKGTDGTWDGPWQYDASQDRIAILAGHPNTPSNPWNNLDAFTATALLMSDNGAPADIGPDPGCPSSGCEAALRYFAGWGNADNPAYAFYGDDVMAFAAQFKSDITTLGGS